MIDGQIALREGDVIDGLTLSGFIESAFLNEDGDWAAIWDVDSGADNLEALILNGEILLLEGDLVDWNNDGLIDGSDQNGVITNFKSGSRGGLTLSDRDGNGDVRLLFNADVDLGGTVLEGGFSMTVSASAVLGDANDDGVLNNLDISAFVLALLNSTAYELMYPNVTPSIRLDMNNDGALNNLDISAFVAAILG